MPGGVGGAQPSPPPPPVSLVVTFFAVAHTAVGNFWAHSVFETVDGRMDVQGECMRRGAAVEAVCTLYLPSRHAACNLYFGGEMRPSVVVEVVEVLRLSYRRISASRFVPMTPSLPGAGPDVMAQKLTLA